MLLLEGARQLNSVRNEVESVDGVVRIIADPTRMLTYGAVVAGRSDQLGNWKPPTKPVKLKSSKEFTVIGTDFPRVDAVAKVTGVAVYGFDARLPDVVFGAVVHPPRYGAKLTASKSSTAESMPGVLKVVIDPKTNFVGVVAKTRGQAERAAAKLSRNGPADLPTIPPRSLVSWLRSRRSRCEKRVTPNKRCAKPTR
jgi:isoquinoline 1-oxidoreductase subunit beta